MRTLHPQNSLIEKIVFRIIFAILPFFSVGYFFFNLNQNSNLKYLLILLLLPVLVIITPFVRKIIHHIKLSDEKVIINYSRFFIKHKKTFNLDDIMGIYYNQSDKLIITTSNRNEHMFVIFNKKNKHEIIVSLQNKFHQFSSECNGFIPVAVAQKSANYKFINQKQKIRNNRMFSLVLFFFLSIALSVYYVNLNIMMIIFMAFSFVLARYSDEYESLIDISFPQDKITLLIKSNNVYQQICFNLDEVYTVNFEEKEILIDGQLTIVFKKKETIVLPVKIGKDNILYEKIKSFETIFKIK